MKLTAETRNRAVALREKEYSPQDKTSTGKIAVIGICLIAAVVFLFLFPGQKMYADSFPGGKAVTFEDIDKLPLFYKSEIDAQKQESVYKNPLVFLFFLPGVLVFIIILLIRKAMRKRGKMWMISFVLLFCLAGTNSAQYAADPVSQGVASFSAGDYEHALRMFRQAEFELGPKAGLSYNMALCYYHLNKKGNAIYELYRARKMDIEGTRISHTLSLMESKQSLASQFNPVPFVRPDMPFIVLIVLFNCTMIIFGLAALFRKGYLAIIFVLLGICTISSAVFFISTEITLREKICVITSTSGMLKQIPLPSSRTWIFLKEGTSLKILGEAQGYYLVRTGRGFEGWIKADDVKVGL